MQDAVQGFHWENSQATLHPFVAYFRSSNGDWKHTGICIISDCLKHDQTAAHCFLIKFITLMKQKVKITLKSFIITVMVLNPNIKIIKVVNLCHHKLDHGIDAVWNFFATSHGTSACDGIGLLK